MNPIQVLMDEHQRIESVMKRLSSWSRGLAGGEQDARSELAEFVEFIQSFTDTLHHGKEEEILFATMVERGFSRQQGPIAVMLSEHAEGRALTATLRVLSECPAPWTEEERSKVVRASRAFVDLLVAHIEKEDQILYPMAESRLSDTDWDEISRRFELFESDAKNAELRRKIAPLITRLEGR